MRRLIGATKIDFVSWGPKALLFSAAAMLSSALALGLLGLNFGLDFTGGTVIEVGYPQAVEIPEVRRALAEAGYGGAQTQYFGTAQDILIRVAPREGEDSAQVSSEILAALQAQDAGATMRRVEFVGPQVGDELVEDGGLALLYALIMILIYVTLRFEWRLAVGTIAAIVHDVVFTLGFFALFQVTFDLTVLAALLAVIGYSVNDSVVVLDRIRENFRKLRRGSPAEVVNQSVNQTLARTLMTSLTTLLAVVVLLLFGGPVIRDFALALLVGVVVGTYSSIFIASITALRLGLSRDDLLPKTAAEVDARP